MTAQWKNGQLERLKSLSDASLLALVLHSAEKVGRNEYDTSVGFDETALDDWMYMQSKLELSKRLPPSFGGFIDTE